MESKLGNSQPLGPGVVTYPLWSSPSSLQQKGWTTWFLRSLDPSKFLWLLGLNGILEGALVLEQKGLLLFPFRDGLPGPSRMARPPVLRPYLPVLLDQQGKSEA